MDKPNDDAIREYQDTIRREYLKSLDREAQILGFRDYEHYICYLVNFGHVSLTEANKHLSEIKAMKNNNYSTNEKKFFVALPDEVADPIRTSVQKISSSDEADIKLDIFLFGKGKDINS